MAATLRTFLSQDSMNVKMARQISKTYGTYSVSGKPWWQMAGCYWLKQAGYPCSVYGSSSGCTLGSGADEHSDDIRARPLASDYDATNIYVSLHTNGYGGNCNGTGCPRGTITYYDCSSEHASWCTVSQNLAGDIQNALVSTIRSYYDSGWTNRGTGNGNGNYGEIRIPNRAAVLIELAFHDSCTTDALALRDNWFRSVSMWGIYKGICDYFGDTPTWGFYSDELVSNTIPSTMNTGETKSVSVTFRNRGVLWTNARAYKLGAVGDSDPFTATTRQLISGEVGPNTTYTFTFNLTAPSTPGTYTTDWRMVRDGYTWFGATCSKAITVSGSDLQAPTVPQNLSATAVSPSQVNLTWSASTDNVGVTGYKVFRDSVQIGTSATASYSDTTATAATTYSYQVSAHDAAGNNSALSTAANVTTPAVDVIVDNPAAVLTGAWSTGTASTDKYGADYQFVGTAATETKSAKWTPTLTSGGTYNVYCWYTQGTNRSTVSPYTVSWNGGSQVVNVNQQTNGGSWRTLVSSKPFAAGTAGYVRLGNGTGVTGDVVVADAVRFATVSIDVTAPTAPSNLAATVISETQVNLTWTGSTDNVAVTQYRIYRDGSEIATSTTTSYSDTSCLPGNTYEYEVSALDAAGNESPLSNLVTATTEGDSTAPSTPTNLAATVLSQTEISLSWTASTDNIGVAGYIIYRDNEELATSATTSFIDTTCAPSTTYSYQVSAYDARMNESVLSEAVQATTQSNDTAAPTVPTELAATAVSGTQIDLTWVASVDNVAVTGYRIFRDNVEIATTADLSYSDTGRTPATSYGYKVSAYDAATNESAPCDPVSATTFDTIAPTTPSGLSATAVSGTQINLSWTGSTDNVGISGYKIYRNGVEFSSTGGTSFSDTTCAPATTYTYQVSAYDDATNESGLSNTAGATTFDTAPPTAPTNLAGTAISQTQINLTWTASTDNVGVTGYKVFRGGVQIGTSGTTSYSDTTCSSYTSYMYEVSAYDAAQNNSALSNQANATTLPYTDLILDNTVATFTATWFTSSSATDKYGTNYRYITTQPTETETATWTPDVDIAGYYTVYCWYPQGSNRSGAAPYTVYWDGSSQTVAVNQKSNGGSWRTLVSTKRFQAGTAGYVKLGNGTGEVDMSVMADAVRFLLISSDLTAPTVPTNLAATATSATQISLTWTASTDNVAVTGYRIYRNDVEVGTSATASYSDSGLTQYTTYTYKVAAYDAMANQSAQSSPDSETTWDGQAPTVPTGLTATAVGPQRINLAWTASTDNVGVTGYKIFRGGVEIATSATNSYSNGGLAPSTAYTFTVAAYDARNNTSAQSTSAGATTPAYQTIIMDNGVATWTGVWTTSTSGTDKYGADYKYASTAASEGKTARWTPTIVYAGNYDTYTWYSKGTNRATNSPFTVYWNGGSQTVAMNQTINGGSWRTLLTGKSFLAGTAGYVKLGNGTGATGKVVVADAVRYVQTSGN